MAIKKFFRDDLVSEVKASEVRLLLPAGCATIDAPVGPTLSQFGINAGDFCKEFNDLTKDIKKNGVLLSVGVTKIGRKFSINIKGPSTSSLLYVCCFNKYIYKKGLDKENLPENGFCIFLSDIYNIAKLRLILNSKKLAKNQRARVSLKGHVKNIISTCFGMELTIIWDI